MVMKRRKKNFIYRLVLFLFVLAQFQWVPMFSLIKPPVADTAGLSNASATLSNSRMSYRAGITSTPETAGASTINIDTAGSNADENTDHLFPNDTICFTDSGNNGCKDQTTYAVNNIVDTDTFTMTPVLVSDLASTDKVIATQSGSLTISFTTSADIPVGGSILITIPALDSDDTHSSGIAVTNDGIPDTNSSISTNGFDLNGITEDDVSTVGCTDADWDTSETITPGTASADSTIKISRTTAKCASGSTITVTIDSDPGIVNPAPLLDSATQGTADVYTIGVETRDDSDNPLESVDIDVAPIEAVFVSTTVRETISFQVAGVAASTTTCGQTTNITTTAMSIPFATLAANDTFYMGSQQLTTSTNADDGYSVKIEENDQMGKDGVTCTGASAGESDNCIKDTTCDSTGCTESTSQDWLDASTYQGLGYSLANVSGTDAAFTYDESSRTFSAKQIADQEASETKQIIMSNGSPVSGSSIYVCYRLDVSNTQPAGYYYNKVKYTATATF